MNKLISYQQALTALESIATPSASVHETVSLSDALHRRAFQTIKSPINVPGFDNAAMDGYAVMAQHVNEQLTHQALASLPVTGRIQAGDDHRVAVNSESAEAWEIMTGAPVPKGFDAVVPFEATTESSKDEVAIDHQIVEGRNIRLAGSDYSIGQTVIPSKTWIQAQHIMALATTGHQQVEVLKQMPVALFSTGNEISESDALGAGQIHNSNQPHLNAFLQQVGCDVVMQATCHDDEKAFKNLLSQAKKAGAQMIVSTGAVSMGRFDFIPKVLQSMGAKIHFHKAKVRPGKPILVAQLADGTVYFGLPGNPIAAASGARFFITPFLRKWQGLAKEQPILATNLSPIKKKVGFRMFTKARASLSESGQLQVEQLSGQGSFQTHSFAQANCWLVLDEDWERVDVGQAVTLLPMVPEQLILT